MSEKVQRAMGLRGKESLYGPEMAQCPKCGAPELAIGSNDIGQTIEKCTCGYRKLHRGRLTTQ